MENEKTVINQELLIWCGVVIAELIVLAYLVHSGLILLIGLVLILPISAAFRWPLEEAIEEDEETKEIEGTEN